MFKNLMLERKAAKLQKQLDELIDNDPYLSRQYEYMEELHNIGNDIVCEMDDCRIKMEMLKYFPKKSENFKMIEEDIDNMRHNILYVANHYDKIFAEASAYYEDNKDKMSADINMLQNMASSNELIADYISYDLDI